MDVFLQKITEEEKQKECRELWRTWFTGYTDRLTREAAKVTDLAAANEKRRELMNSTNPRSVPPELTLQTPLADPRNSHTQGLIQEFQNGGGGGGGPGPGAGTLF